MITWKKAFSAALSTVAYSLILTLIALFLIVAGYDISGINPFNPPIINRTDTNSPKFLIGNIITFIGYTTLITGNLANLMKSTAELITEELRIKQ